MSYFSWTNISTLFLSPFHFHFNIGEYLTMLNSLFENFDSDYSSDCELGFIIIGLFIQFFKKLILDFSDYNLFGLVIGCFVPVYFIFILFASPMDLSQMVTGELAQRLEQRNRYQGPEIVAIGFEAYRMYNNYYIYIFNKNKLIDPNSPLNGFILGLSGRNSFPIRHALVSLPETNRQAHCTILTIPSNSLNNIRSFMESDQSRIRVQCNPLAFSRINQLLTTGNQPIFPNNIEQERNKTFTSISK